MRTIYISFPRNSKGRHAKRRFSKHALNGLKSRGAFLKGTDSPVRSLDILALTPLALLLSTARIRRAARARPKLAGKKPRRSRRKEGSSGRGTDECGRSRKRAQTSWYDRILLPPTKERGKSLLFAATSRRNRLHYLMACTGSRLPRDRVAKTGEVGSVPFAPRPLSFARRVLRSACKLIILSTIAFNNSIRLSIRLINRN